MALEHASFNDSVAKIKSLNNLYDIPIKVMIRDKELLISNLIKGGITKEQAITIEIYRIKLLKKLHII